MFMNGDPKGWQMDRQQMDKINLYNDLPENQ